MLIFALESIFLECDKEFVTKEFLQYFEDLSKDNIPNVRLSASKILSNILKSEQWNNDKTLLQIANEFLKDSDQDVVHFMLNSKISISE
jgi:hypothetical protein